MTCDFHYLKCHIKVVGMEKGGMPLLQRKGIFTKIFCKDSQKQKKLLLAHTPNQWLLYHEYVIPPKGDCCMILVANCRVREVQVDLFEKNTVVDYPYLYMIIDTTNDEPLIAIEDFRYFERDIDEVGQVLQYSLNRAMEFCGLETLIVEYEPTDEEKIKINNLMKNIDDPQTINRTLETKYGLKKTDFLIRNFLEYREKATKPKKSNNFRDYIKHANKDLVITVIHKALKDTEELVSKSVARIFRFLADFEVLYRPKFEAVKREFPEIIGHASEGRFNFYTNEDNHPFSGDPAYYELFETLKILLT